MAEKKKYKNIILSPGNYVGVIANVEWKNSIYCRNQKNEDGRCLSVWIDVRNDKDQKKRLFSDIPVDNLEKINQFRTAMGLKQLTKLEEFDLQDFLERTIETEVDVYTSKVGKKSNIVRAYLDANDHHFEEKEEEDGESSSPF